MIVSSNKTIKWKQEGEIGMKIFGKRERQKLKNKGRLCSGMPTEPDRGEGGQTGSPERSRHTRDGEEAWLRGRPALDKKASYTEKQVKGCT